MVWDLADCFTLRLLTFTKDLGLVDRTCLATACTHDNDDDDDGDDGDFIVTGCMGDYTCSSENL